tara:strand:- start:662 stop:946 length:285 start_codon:yes stop_codon:yes gene_type:complete
MSQKIFLDNKNLDTVMKVLISLARETYVLKDRLSLIETIMDKKGVVTKGDLSNYVLSMDERKKAKKRSDEFINNIMMPIISDYSDVADKDDDRS